MTTAPLDDIRVLDLSRVLAGPWATQLLGDLGAEIIKVEKPDGGDDTRTWGPPFLGDSDKGLSAYFLSANRGKKSVTIDFSKPEGQQLIRELAQKSDVLVENFKVDGLAKLGLDYATLSKLNPKLVYCSITGFGQNGPHKDRAGYDLIVQAMGGLMSVTGGADAEPTKAGVALTDIMTGIYASSAILAALYERKTSGEGQHIDLCLLDVQICTLANQAMNYLVSGDIPVRHGNAHPNIVPYQSFETSSGHIVIAIGNDSQFVRFCEILGEPSLPADPRFKTNAARVYNRVALLDILKRKILAADGKDLLLKLDATGVPAAPINALDAVFSDPQISARGLAVERQIDGLADPVRLLGNPIHFSRTPIANRRVPPSLGDSTNEILSTLLGMDERAIN
ncbi:MAG TPA: CaiB/BaiF CoA-transferase family protein, partial [Afipia sp.]